MGNVDQAEVVVAGVASQTRNGLLHVEVRSLGQNPFGLLDDDAGVERFTQLLVEHLGLETPASLRETSLPTQGDGRWGTRTLQGDVAADQVAARSVPVGLDLIGPRKRRSATLPDRLVARALALGATSEHPTAPAVQELLHLAAGDREALGRAVAQVAEPNGRAGRPGVIARVLLRSALDRTEAG